MTSDLLNQRTEDSVHPSSHTVMDQLPMLKAVREAGTGRSHSACLAKVAGSEGKRPGERPA